jgi:hypothetical protein
LLLLSGCARVDKPDTSAVVSRIPWESPATWTYDLEDNGTFAGTTTLSVEEADGETLLVQRSEDDEGNSDEARVSVAPDTLLPRRSTRTIIDADEKRVAEACYETPGGDDCADVDAAACDDDRAVRIEQLVFDPPDEPTPDRPRAAPLCLPEHAYDNDSSLFLWRTLRFEEDYTVSYTTVIAGRREKQVVTLEVLRRVTDTPVGEADAWLVSIAADGQNQRAWIAAADSHELLAYQNDTFMFRLRR